MTGITSIRRCLVAGSGLMGSGIAQVFAQHGLEVDLVDVKDEFLEAGMSRIDKSLERFARKGVIPDKKEVLTRVTPTTDLDASAHRADFVVESITEREEVKRDLFRTLDAHCRRDVIFASNTSHLSITRLASYTTRPDRFVGFHWSNPPPMMPLIEVIPGDRTSRDTLNTAIAVAQKCRKEVAVLKKDVEGFVSNRLSTIFFIEALRLLDEGVADADDIDRICVQMYGHKMGPLATLDLAGLDTALLVSEGLMRRYGDRFRPPELLYRLVAAGRYGEKAGSGIRDGSGRAQGEGVSP